MHVLFLSPWFPYPPDNGSKIRVYHLLRALVRNHEVTLLSFVREGESVDESGAKRLCGTVKTVPWLEFVPWKVKAILGFFTPLPRSVLGTFSRAMADLVEETIERDPPDVIVASEFGTALYACKWSPRPKVLDDIEVGAIHDAWSGAPSRVLRWRRALTWIKTRYFVGRLAREFDVCTVVSKKEWALVREAAPSSDTLHLVPNGVNVSALRPDSADPQPNTLIYNGALTYSANYDAMRYFLSDILPRIHTQAPEVQMRITGSTRGVDVAALPIDGRVILTGYIADIHREVAQASACVAPLRIGSGTRIKILEAMALGTPVVSTSKGIEGLEVTPEEHLLIGDTPEAFANQTVRLLRDLTLRNILAQNARRLVEEKYDWQKIGLQFVELVEQVARQT